MITSTLYLLHFNNYYNRIIKRFDTLSEYLPYALTSGPQTAITGINFIPGNYVSTTQLINWNGPIGDYLLVVDEDGNIDTRWFVMGHERVRQGQFKLLLRRDLVADYYDNILHAPCFIEKGTITNPSENNLIFNREDMTYNQIKTSEVLLKDKSNCPWICIYAASKDSSGESIEYTANIEARHLPVAKVFTEAQWNNLTQYNTLNPIIGGMETPTVQIFGRGSQTDDQWYRIDTVNSSSTSMSVTSSTVKGRFTSVSAAMVRMNTIYDSLISERLYTDFGVNTLIYSEFAEINNQFVQVNYPNGTTKVFKVTVRESTESKSIIYWASYVDGHLDYANPNYNTIVWFQDKLSDVYITQPPYNLTERCPRVSTVLHKYYLSTQEITDTTTTSTVNIQKDRFHLTDAPYDMFCIPYSDTLKIKTSAGTLTANTQLAFEAGTALAAKYSSAGQLYDIQILPYCPIVNSEVINGVLDVSSQGTRAFSTINAAGSGQGQIGAPEAYILHASISSFARDIVLENPIVIQDYKIESECDLYRLCSPNYNGVFEFNAAKNGGVSVIHAVCTYKPYSPYIKLFPDFGRLYGYSTEEGDSRGLICGGDYSLPIVSSAWETYQLQNKNYQASFDRQIQNLEINQKYERIREGVGAAVGTLSGAVSGAAGGAMVGGPVGAIAGAVVGGVSSLAGGITDYAINEKLRKETLDYTKDQFGYSLGNIKALPMSLSRSSSISVDNKYFPFLEYYTCSNIEKDALRNKIKYNGMTIMVVGTISQYNTGSGDYIKGKLMRVEDVELETEMLGELAAEINKGVYLYGNNSSGD